MVWKKEEFKNKRVHFNFDYAKMKEFQENNHKVSTNKTSKVNPTFHGLLLFLALLLSHLIISLFNRLFIQRLDPKLFFLILYPPNTNPTIIAPDPACLHLLQNGYTSREVFITLSHLSNLKVVVRKVDHFGSYLIRYDWWQCQQSENMRASR